MEFLEISQNIPRLDLSSIREEILVTFVKIYWIKKIENSKFSSKLMQFYQLAVEFLELNQYEYYLQNFEEKKNKHFCIDSM